MDKQDTFLGGLGELRGMRVVLSSYVPPGIIVWDGENEIHCLRLEDLNDESRVITIPKSKLWP